MADTSADNTIQERTSFETGADMADTSAENAIQERTSFETGDDMADTSADKTTYEKQGLTIFYTSADNVFQEYRI